MRRFVIWALALTGMMVTLTACSTSGDATEQSLIRTATAFSGGARLPVISSPSPSRPVPSPTPRTAASVSVPSTPTPLPALVASAVIRIGSPATLASPTPTPRTAGPTATPAPQVVTITADSSVNLRSDPASDAMVVTQIPPGADVTVLQSNVPATDGGDVPWVQVSYNGQAGYVRNDLVGPLHAASTSAAATPGAAGAVTTTHVSPTLSSTATRSR